MTHLLVVGGGAAAVLVTAAWLEGVAAEPGGDHRVTVVGREATVGRGIAYGRADAHHRLNSPAGKMGLTEGDPGAFLDWLGQSGWRDVDGSPAVASSFVPRPVFGDYLEASFQGFVDDEASGVRFVRGEVVDLVEGDASVTATLAGGDQVTADLVVLALGNPAPGVVPAAAARVVDDPWDPRALDGITADDRVLLVGTGLTMIDIATSLARRHPGILITATSRHLLLPEVHPAVLAPPGPGLEPGRLGELISGFGRQIREAKASGSGWQAVIDGIRPQIPALWHGLALSERRRFLVHAARRWDTHRHRMAGVVHTELAGLIEGGTLEIRHLTPGDRFDVAFNCTGPQSVADRGWSPLVDSLLDAGLVVADPTMLGLDAEVSGAVRTAAGGRSSRVWALGTALKGVHWESTPVPEIRKQAFDLARGFVTVAAG
jgi:uncharacterized NAD(P)/FAD-binding protein YdhS